MSLLYPITLLAPLLLLAAFFWRRRSKEKVLFPSVALLKSIPPSLTVQLRTPVLCVLTGILAVLLSLAAARPQKISADESPQQAHDLMLVIDLSGSMRERDYRSGLSLIDRLEAVKMVLAEFVKSRKQDRIGVVAFGTSAFLQSPLTMDHQLVTELLNLLEIGMAGEGTAIGDGLGVALKGLRDIKSASKAIVLLTDGANNSGTVSPLQAAAIGQKMGIKIHTVGMGAPVDMRRTSLFKQGGEYDEKTLKEIAEKTGGVFFNATDLADLKKVYDEIDKLEERKDEESQRIILKEYTPDIAAVALVVSALLLVLNSTMFLKIPG